MTRGMIYKGIFIIVIIAVAVLLILPTIGEKTMDVYLKKDITKEQIADIKKLFPAEKYTFEVKTIKDKVSGKESPDKIIVTGMGYALTDAKMNEMRIQKGVIEAKLLKHWVEKVLLAKKINLGLDLQGGMHLSLRASFEDTEKKINGNKKKGDAGYRELSEKDKNEITQQALEMLRNRVDKFGVSEPTIRPRGAEVIEIMLPGVKDPKKVRKAIGETGQLQYRIVDDKYSVLAAQWFKENYKDFKATKDIDLKKIINEMSLEIKLPKNLEILFYYMRDKDTKKIVPQYPMALETKVSVSGTDIQEASVDKDEYNQIIVNFRTTPEGSVKFAEATSKKNKGKRLAIILDNKVRNAPNIKDQISSGRGQISGGFTFDEAQVLARIIKEGALPVNLKIIEERTVGPSLGQDSIDSGIKAIMIGLAGVMLFMLVYYKLGGLIANLGLILNLICMLALLSLLGFTLTLPGIAAFILTVGMAVDANVIIYERIKEEVSNGKSPRMSIKSGFEKAFWTIVDANLTTIIAAFILSQFGTGPIKGFAVTLLIGILSSMFVALYITRFIYEIISLNKNLKKLSI